MNAHPTFEDLLLVAESLPVPQVDSDRDVHWCDATKILGMARQSSGGIELFLRGEELRSSSPLVRRFLKFDEWARTNGDVFRANRIVFPSEEHYTAAAAFLAEEFFRNNVVNSLVSAFAQTEPLVEMMLRRIALSEEEILGLLGELRFLEVLISIADEVGRAIVIDAWRGHERSARDFVFNTCFVEVKSTRGSRSVHRVNSVMQADPRRSETGEFLERLFLLSFGFTPVLTHENSESGISLAIQVETILGILNQEGDAMRVNPIQSLFLQKLANYGGVANGGYIHDEMKNWLIYQSRWHYSFLRIYDMCDDAIQVLRRSDIQMRSHVLLETVSFDVSLPDTVTGDINPSGSILEFSKKVLGIS